MRSPRDLYAHSRLRSPELKNLASCGWGPAAAGVGDILRLLGPAGSGGIGPRDLLDLPSSQARGQAFGESSWRSSPRRLDAQGTGWPGRGMSAALGPCCAVQTWQTLHQGQEEVCRVGSWHPPLHKRRRARS